MYETFLEREYILRKYLNFNTADYNEVDADEVSKFIEWNIDEKMQSVIDLYRAGGESIDLLKPEQCGTHYYKDWWDRKREEEEIRHEEVPTVSKEEAEKINEIFTTEIQRVVGRKHLKKNIAG